MAKINKYLRALQKPRPIFEMLRNSQLLFEAAEQLNLHPQWTTDYGLFSIQYEGKIHFLFHTFSALNNHASSVFAKNKHITRLILAKANLRNIPFCLPKNKTELNHFFAVHKSIIAKPVAGTNSWNVFLIKTKSELAKVPYTKFYFEKYMEGVEYRYLILNNEVIYIQEKLSDPIKTNPWHKKKRSIPKSDWVERQSSITLALNIAKIMNLNFCAVDFIKNNGVDWLLEVNASPGLSGNLELAKQYLLAYQKLI